MSPKTHPLVGLITNFGERDSYIGEIKAAYFAVARFGQIIDISHQISAGDIASGAYLLFRASLVFPEDSIFVAVIDPGVGSNRQAVIIRSGKRILIGPDNDVFARVINWESNFEVRVISWKDVDHNRRSTTFHGRDLFMPIAAQISCGADFRKIGVSGRLVGTFCPAKLEKTSYGWKGRVLYVDGYGNIATDLPNQVSGKIKLGLFDKIRYSETYSIQPKGELFWLPGSDGCIEIAINRGHAGNKTGVLPGDPVEIYDNRP